LNTKGDEMTEDFDGEYGSVVVAVTAAGLPDVVSWLNRHAQIMSKLRTENESLRDENKRLHTRQEELHAHLAEQRERLKPEAPLVSRRALLMALEVLDNAEVLCWTDAENIHDWIGIIKAKTKGQDNGMYLDYAGE
jgi:hypothetical protein